LLRCFHWLLQLSCRLDSHTNLPFGNCCCPLLSW